MQSGKQIELSHIPVSDFVFSQTKAQVERRAHFDKAALEGKEAKKALQTYGGEFVRPDYHVDGDSKYRSYAKLLGKDLSKVIAVAVDPDTGRAHELIDKKAARELIKKKGVKLAGTAPATSTKRSAKEIEKEKAERELQEQDQKYLCAVAKATFEKANTQPLTLDELAEVGETLSENYYSGDQLLKAITGKDYVPDFGQMNIPGAIRWIRVVLQATRIEDGDRKVILDEGKRHGVDVEKIKAELEPKKEAAPPGPRPAKTTKKKTAKKK